jgi:hypothetical protein
MEKDRDFTHGEAAVLWSEAQQAGATPVSDAAEALQQIERSP